MSRAALCLLAFVAACRADAPDGMAWVPGETFDVGAVAHDPAARPDEFPRRVTVDGFWADRTEVTNRQFRAFVDATGYVTTAERKPDWEALKQQLPPGAPRPPDEVLVAGALVFDGGAWRWVAGASWRHPRGPADTVDGKGDWPVVQVSLEDAQAYARWAGKALPTEAQWELAARGGVAGEVFPWGDEVKPGGAFRANYWQGRFPDRDDAADGFAGAAPVGSFPPNRLGLQDVMGNVWEWTADLYVAAPGAPAGFDPDEPAVPKVAIRGGSFMCHERVCFSYRSSAKMRTSPDTAATHTGFRCVRNAPRE